MTITEARAIVDGKQYHHPEYRAARLFIDNWLMENDAGYRRRAARAGGRTRVRYTHRAIIAERG